MNNVTSATTRKAEANIVYEDDYVRAIWRQGASPYVFITFGDAAVLADDLNFYASKPAEKLDLTVLGIMAKSPTWFPGESIRGVRRAIDERVSPYTERIMHGSSMGGYAALKYSALFAAATVISFCPQWTIDPSECDGFDPGWQYHFDRPLMTGMGIRKSEVCGRGFIFSDPYHNVDSYHRDQIVALAPDTVCIPVYNGDHDIAPILAGTDNLACLIEGCRKGDIISLQKLVSRSRRGSFYRTRGVAERLLKQRPTLLARLAAGPMTDVHLRGVIADRSLRLVQAIAMAGELDELERLIDNFSDQASLRDKLDLAIAASDGADISFSLQTCFGTNVLYDRFAKTLCHSRAEESTRYKTVRLVLSDVGLTMALKTNFCDLTFSPDDGGRLGLLLPNPKPFAYSVRENGQINLSYDGKFLSALPDGTVVCDRDGANDWETFAIDLRVVRH